MINKVPPCKGCQDREVGCHGKCTKYIEWNKQVEEIREKRINIRELENAHYRRVSRGRK